MPLSNVGRMLIIAGIVLIGVGLLFVVVQRFGGWPRLPGDFVFRRGNVTVYVPLATSLIVSLLLSLLFYLFRR